MQKLFDILDAIKNFFESIPAWFVGLVQSVFGAIWNALTDLLIWFVEQLLDVAISAASGLDVSGISSQISAFGSIPTEMVNIMSLCGFDYCMGILLTALTIRLLLQLIPFVRLGS